ncbi:MAG: hypothetical protein IBJ00_02045 [Alphaproteobacteria bacterium]|nr:hypothetical protein [Alphaproteobacteria bacterium]
MKNYLPSLKQVILITLFALMTQFIQPLQITDVKSSIQSKRKRQTPKLEQTPSEEGSSSNLPNEEPNKKSEEEEEQESAEQQKRSKAGKKQAAKEEKGKEKDNENETEEIGASTSITTPIPETNLKELEEQDELAIRRLLNENREDLKEFSGGGDSIAAIINNLTLPSTRTWSIYEDNNLIGIMKWSL